MKLRPSNEPVVENAQHDPHDPWFLTAVTAPFDLQSTVAGPVISITGTSTSDEEVKAPFKQEM